MYGVQKDHKYDCHCFRGFFSGTATLLHDHVRHVTLDDVVFVIKVEHGHGAEFGGYAAGVDRTRTHASHAVLVNYCCVK